MTYEKGQRPGAGALATTSDSPRSYIEGTTGLEERDSILAALRANGHQVWTNDDNSYTWFTECPNTNHDNVRISSGHTVQLACIPSYPGADCCDHDTVITALGLGDLMPTAASHLDRLRAALVDTDGLDRIPDPEPLIGEDILFLDQVAWMIGKPGCMKSFTALDMAGCVGTGEVWQGYRVVKGPVLYLIAEGVRGTKKRVRAWEKAMGQPMTGVHFLPVAVQSKVHSQWDAFVELTAELQPVLIIVDTQARVTVSVEENSNTQMGEFFAQIERLREASGAAVLIVHHMGRDGGNGRGASSMDGAFSTIIKVEKKEDHVILTCDKSKDGEEWDPITLRAVPMGESVVLMQSIGGRPPSRNDLMSRAWIQDWWRVHRSEPVSVSVLVKSEVVSEPTFHRSKVQLIELGLVTKEGTGNLTKYRLTSDPTLG